MGTTWETQGLFNSIQSLALDQYGRMHVLDMYMDQVQILDPVTGAYITHYNAYTDPAGVKIQLDIDISKGGKVIMTNVATKSVEQIYTVP